MNTKKIVNNNTVIEEGVIIPDTTKYYIRNNNVEKGFEEVTHETYTNFNTFLSNVDMYVKLIKEGNMSIEDVDDALKTAVKSKLELTIKEKAAAYDKLMGDEINGDSQ